MTRRALIALCTRLDTGFSCSSGPPPAVEVVKACRALTGLHALYQLYTSARAWAQDLQVLRYSSINIREVQHEEGKAAAWQVVFVSQALAKSRTWTFSAFYEASATLHQEFFPEASRDRDRDRERQAFSDRGGEDRYGQGVGNSFEAVTAEYNGKNPQMPISYTLGMDSGNDPVWRVIWGESAGESSFSVLVDASTGDFMRIVH